MEGYERVDPQHPLGGPDGKKDILFRRDNNIWIAACYFPTTEPNWAAVKKKFADDLGGVKSNNAAGIAFFVNQQLTIGDRKELAGLAMPVEADVYHLERMVGLLNSAKGCGLRLQYLHIAMSEAEQWAFWNARESDIVERLKKIEKTMAEHAERTMAEIRELREQQSSTNSEPMRGLVEIPSAALTAEMILWIHRIVTESDEANRDARGKFRAIEVWIGKSDSTPATATFVPVSPGDIIPRLSELITWWREAHHRLRGAQRVEVASSLAELHWRFLQIHPFLDGNGRVARVLLDQAAQELLHQRIGPEFLSDPTLYYAAMKAADRGDLGPLQQLILAALQ